MSHPGSQRKMGQGTAVVPPDPGLAALLSPFFPAARAELSPPSRSARAERLTSHLVERMLGATSKFSALREP